MSERDCGKWYCQRAAGYSELEYGVDILLYPGARADADDRRALDAERDAITGTQGPEPAGWMGLQRDRGFKEWLAAYSHANGAASHYWVWDPDSRGRYMEAMGPYKPGEVPADIGELHRGRGWQLPLVAVMTDRPTPRDIAELRQVKVPFVVLPQDQPDEPEPPDNNESVIDLLEQAIDLLRG